MTDSRFTVVVADPPWTYERGAGLEGCPTYSTMSLDALAALGPWVQAVTAPNSVLLLWATYPKLGDAFSLLEGWGYRQRTGAPWIKTAPGAGTIRRGIGFWFQAAAEQLLVGTRGKISPGRTRQLGLLCGSERTFYAPRRQHSEKPDDIFAYVERFLPTPRLELFARRTRPGWTCLGLDTGWRLTPDGPVQVDEDPTQPRGWWASDGCACAACGGHFIPRRSDAKTCSHACRQRLYRARRRAATK